MRLIQRVLTAMIMLAALVACTGDGDPVLTSVEGAGWTSQLGATGGIIEITFDKNDAAATGAMPAQKVNANNTVELFYLRLHQRRQDLCRLGHESPGRDHLCRQGGDCRGHESGCPVCPLEQCRQL